MKLRKKAYMPALYIYYVMHNPSRFVKKAFIRNRTFIKNLISLINNIFESVATQHTCYYTL